MESFLILALIAACVHLGISVKPDEDLKYSGPVVYTNLPPPVLYFPNFPEEPEISREDEVDKRIEYVPFPYKDLPLLIYQSDSQPPVHVVEKPSSQDEEQEDASKSSAKSKTSYQTGPALYQQSDYVQPNRPQQQSAQSQSPEGSREQYVTRNVPDLFPDLKNQQYISIGVSTYQGDAPLNLMYSVPKPPVQPASNPTSQSQQKQNVGQYESQSAMQKSPRQKPVNPQMQYPDSAASGQAQQQQQYALVQNGGQSYAQEQGMSNTGSQQIQNVMVQNTDGGQQYYQTNQKVVMQYPQGMVNENRGQQMLQAPQQNGSPQQQYQGQQMMVNMKQQSAMVSNNGQQVQTAMPQLPIYPVHVNNNQLPRGPQQAVYQQASSNSANSQQHLGGSVATMQPTNNAQRQMMPKNVPQSMPQQEQMKQQVQSESGRDVAQKGQYLNIGVYPYDGINNEPQQFYTFVIPQNAQQQDNSGQPKTPYQNQQYSNSMEMKNQQMSQGYRNGDGSSENEQNSNQQKNTYMTPNKQMAPVMNKENVENQMKMQDKRNRPQAQNTGPSNEDSPIEYQHILIHIPHNTSPQPQISAQQNTDESSGMRYSGSTQSAGFSDGSNKLQNSAMNNQNIPPRNGFYKAFKGSSSDFSSEYDNLRSPAMPKFPPEGYSGMESKYSQSLIRNPFENSFGRSKRRPQFRGHPGAYASSNLQYSLVNPFSANQRFQENFNRKPHGFAEASMARPSFIQSPVRQRFQNSFHPAFPEDFMAEPSFHSPSLLAPGMLESSNLTDFKFLDDAESEVYYNGPEQIDGQAYRGQNIVEDNAEKLFEKFNQDVFSGAMSDFGKMKTGQTAMELMSFHQQPVPLPLPVPPPIRSMPVMPFMPYQYQALQGPRYPPMQAVYNDRQKGNVKYGGFIRKLAALSTTLLSQKLGIKTPITNREESKNAEIHPRDGFTVEEINEPELIETIQPSSTVIKTDTQGLDGIPIPLNPNRRISNPDQKSRSPPIIVYKGKEPPMEVYGTKEDIEKMKSDTEDPVEASASETNHKMSDQDSGLDYFDVMYSLLPEFIKHTISNRNDDAARGGWLPVDSAESAALESPLNVTVSDDEVREETSTSSGGTFESDTWSAFKEDLKELMRLWPKEEKSDLLTP